MDKFIALYPIHYTVVNDIPIVIPVTLPDYFPDL